MRDDVLIRHHIRREAVYRVGRHVRQRLDHLGIMWMQPARKHGLAPLGDAMRHQHRLARAGRAVIHGSVGDIHLRERGHLRLELEQILQRALRDFRLIGRVAGQKLRALDQVVDSRRHMMLVRARADEEGRSGGVEVLRRHPAKDRLDLDFGFMPRQIDKAMQERGARDVIKKRIDRWRADFREHGRTVFGGVGEIAHQHGQVAPLEPLSREGEGSGEGSMFG